MKPLSQSSLFELQDSTSGIKKMLLDYQPKLDNLNITLLEDELNTINKRFNFPLKNKVIDDVTGKKRVIPIHNQARIKIPTYIPAYLYNLGGSPVAIVNLTNYGNLTKEGHYNIDARKLFAMLQTGSVLLGCYQNWNRISMNQNIIKLGSNIYAKIFTKVLDKMFAVNLDPIKADKVRFLAAKFFLLNLLNKSDSETVFNVAYASTANGTPKTTIAQLDKSIPPESYVRLETFIKQLSVHIEGLSALTLRSYIDGFFKMYGTSALFALEFFPYFCHMLFSVAVGAHLNSEYIIESLAGPDLLKLYNEVSNIIR